MAKNPSKIVQVVAHCSSCLLESKVDPSALGRPHRKHNVNQLSKQAWQRNTSKWMAGPAPKVKPVILDEASNITPNVAKALSEPWPKDLVIDGTGK